MLTGERIIAARQTVEARYTEAGLSVLGYRADFSGVYVDDRGGVRLTVELYVPAADVEATHVAMREAAQARFPAPVCACCDDTHRVTLDDREVPCEHCPVPCGACRSQSASYCAATPCPCRCHVLEARDAATREEDRP